MHEVKIILRRRMDLFVVAKVYHAREIEGAKIVNKRHVLQLLHVVAFDSVLESLFEFFTSIHLLVFGCSFFVGQRLSC